MDLSERLINWGRCERDGSGGSAARCISIESRFKHPPDPQLSIETANIFYQRGLISADELQTAYETRQKARSAPPDRKDGALVEKAWSRVPSASCKALLKMFYVKRREPAYIARRLRVDFDCELIIAQAAIEIELMTKTSKIEAFPSMRMRRKWFTNALHGSLAGAFN